MGGGGDSGGSSYDPQIGQAALKNSQISQEAMDWTKAYYADTVSPLEKAANARAEQAHAQQVALTDRQIADYDQQRAMYSTYGMPAIRKYYDMVDQYSQAGEEERQAAAGMADVTTAAQQQQAQLRQQFASMGIDPTSPAAVSAMTDANMMNTAAAAAAANKARNAARTLGMQLKSDAANFSSGIPSQMTSMGQTAGASNMAGAALGQQGVQNALASGSFVQGGYKTALTGFGNSLQGYVSAGNSQRNAAAQMDAANSAGTGQMIGAGVGLAASAAVAFI